MSYQRRVKFALFLPIFIYITFGLFKIILLGSYNLGGGVV